MIRSYGHLQHTFNYAYPQREIIRYDATTAGLIMNVVDNHRQVIQTSSRTHGYIVLFLTRKSTQTEKVVTVRQLSYIIIAAKRYGHVNRCRSVTQPLDVWHVCLRHLSSFLATSFSQHRQSLYDKHKHLIDWRNYCRCI